MASWPAVLPQVPLLDGFSCQPAVNGLIATEMDVGPPKVRRRFTTSSAAMQASWVLNDEQLDVFFDFFEIELADGALSFTAEHPLPPHAPVVMLFDPASPPNFIPIGNDLWRIEARLILPSGLAPVIEQSAPGARVGAGAAQLAGATGLGIGQVRGRILGAMAASTAPATAFAIGAVPGTRVSGASATSTAAAVASASGRLVARGVAPAVTANASAAGAGPMATWMANRGPRSTRGFNIGTMAITGSSLVAWRNYMGFQSEFIGAACLGAGSSGVNQFTIDNFDELFGGPHANGDNSVTWPSQISWDRIPQCTDVWNHTNGVTTNDWFGAYITLAPLGAPLSACIDTANGVYDDRFKRMGARMAWQLSRCGHRLDRLALRPNWEMDQDTGLRITSPAGTSFWQAAEHAGNNLTQAVQLYLDFVGRAVLKIREGYGQYIPIAYSPAYEPTQVPASYGSMLPYASLLVGHDIACCSFHPDYRRITTVQATTDMVQSTTISRNTPALVVSSARAQGKSWACFEHSCRHEVDFVLPSRNLTNLALSYDLFGQFCADNSDILFATAGLSSAMNNPDYLQTLRYPNPYNANPSLAGTLLYPDPNHANVGHWRSMVQMHKARFGLPTS